MLRRAGEFTEPQHNALVLYPEKVKEVYRRFSTHNPRRHRSISPRFISGAAFDTSGGFWSTLERAGGISNDFIDAIHLAYIQELPLELRPDDIWLLILHGLGNHLHKHSEECRESLGIQHDGKAWLRAVQEHDLHPESRNNDWTFLCDSPRPYGYQIGDCLQCATGDSLGMFMSCNYSTSTKASIIAAGFAIMKSVSKYFEFGCDPSCGIPEIKLRGQPQDWILLKEKAATMTYIHLEWWWRHLSPVLDEFIALSRHLNEGTPLSEVSREFWKGLYFYENVENPDHSSGWFTVFFPYTCDANGHLRSNDKLGIRQQGRNGQFQYQSISHRHIPCGYTETNLDWNLPDGQNSDMTMVGGFMGVQQDRRTGIIRPGIGWAVVKED